MAKAARQDAKARALAEQGVLNPAPERVQDPQFRTGTFFDPRDLVQVKYEMLRRGRAEGATVTDAAQIFGVSRPTYYQAQRALAHEGLPGLLPKRPGPKGAHKVTDEVMAFLDTVLSEEPGVGSAELSERVRTRFGRSVHPRSIERARARRKKNAGDPRERVESRPRVGRALRTTPRARDRRRPARLRPSRPRPPAARRGGRVDDRRGRTR
jgi:transposase